MSLSTNYQINGTSFTNIFDTSEPGGSYIGQSDIVTGIKDNGTDIGSLITNNLYQTINMNTNYNFSNKYIIQNLAIKLPIPENQWNSISVSSSGQYMIAALFMISSGAYGGIYYSSNSGNTWSRTLEVNYPNVVALSSNSGYAIATTNSYVGDTTTKGIYYSTNYGYTWYSTTSSIPPTSWTDISITSSGQYCIACAGTYTNSNYGFIYYSSNYGISWNKSDSPQYNWGCLQISSDGSYAYAINNSNTVIYYSTNQGVNWLTKSSPNTNYYNNKISTSSTGKYVFICGYYGYVHYSSDSANSWNTTTLGTKNWNRINVSSTGNYAYVTEYNGYVYYSNDYGYSWNSINKTEKWSSIIISYNEKYVFASTGSGAMYNNNSWVSEIGNIYTLRNIDLCKILNVKPMISNFTLNRSNSVTGNWLSIAISSAGNYAIACTPSKIYWSNDSGVNWTSSANTASNYGCLAMSSSGKYCLACADYGYIYYSTNCGVSWTSTGVTRNWKTIAMSSSGQYAVAGTWPGTVYYSTDSGVTWNSSTSNIPVTYSVAISSSGQYAVAGCLNASNSYNDGDIYWSSDSGKTWAKATCTRSEKWQGIAISGSGKYAIACGFGEPSTFGIFYSTDYGKSWRESGAGIGYWTSVSISSSGKYAVATNSSGSSTPAKHIAFSSNYGSTWTTYFTSASWQKAAISSSGQYTLVCDSSASGYIYYIT